MSIQTTKMAKHYYPGQHKQLLCFTNYRGVDPTPNCLLLEVYKKLVEFILPPVMSPCFLVSTLESQKPGPKI